MGWHTGKGWIVIEFLTPLATFLGMGFLAVVAIVLTCFIGSLVLLVLIVILDKMGVF